MVIEISFPRGGRKPPATNKTPKIKQDYDLFGGDKRKEKQKNKEKKAPEKEQPVLDSEISAVSADLLSYRSLQDGMVILGCVREVQKMTLGITLPGRLSGRVMVTHISTPYTHLLHSIVDNTEPEGYKTLRQLFTPGECVPTKVIKIDGTDEKFRIGLSLMPEDINSQLTHKSVMAGMLLWGAISSSEEHGYVVDLGIKNCRAFLQKTNVDEGKEYAIGQLIWCVVQKCDATAIAATVSLNAMTEKIQSTKILKDISLDHLLPGMMVDLTVSKLLMNGLEGKFLNDYTGYVHEGQLSGIMDKLKSYSVEQVVEARIMYVMPVTKLAYLTLRSLEPHDRGKLQDGAIMSCKILGNTKGGLYLQLSNTEKGFVSFRRLKTGVPLNSELDDKDMVKKNYPKGSKHQCRILTYDYLDRVYICTLEQELLKEKVFTLRDLKVGQEVTAIIKEIQNNGLLVEIGKVTGFIQNEHLSEIIMSSINALKGKFHVGQKIKARVWNLNEESGSLLLTMKPSLLKTEENLISYEQAEFNKQFPGVVMQISTHGLLIGFFGKVSGWVPRTLMSIENVAKPQEVFKLGQVVNCTVIKCNLSAKRLTLSLQPPKATSKRKQVRLGQHVNVTVTKISQSGLEVTVDDTNVAAIVPLLHISKFPSLAPLLADTYQEGDKLNDLVCVNNTRGVPILSMKNAHLNEANVPQFEELQVNDLLACSVQVINDKHLLLQSPIHGFKRFLTVPPENITGHENMKKVNIQRNQSLMAKIEQIKKLPLEIIASTKLYDCWNYDLNVSIQLLSEYLSEVQRIKENFSSLHRPLAALKLGELVTGTVKEETELGSYIIELSNGAKAFVPAEHTAGELSIGSEVKGIVLWLNFEKDYAEISLSQNVINRINQKQTGNMSIPVGQSNGLSNAKAEILLVKENFVLVALRGTLGKRQLVFLPSKLHINDLKPNLSYYVVGDVVKIEISRAENGVIIGVLKQLIKDLVHIVKSTFSRVRKLSLSSQDEEEPQSKRQRVESNTVIEENTKQSTKKVENNVTETESRNKKKDKKPKAENKLTEVTNSVNKETNKNGKTVKQNDETKSDEETVSKKKKNKKNKKIVENQPNEQSEKTDGSMVQDETSEDFEPDNKKRKVESDEESIDEIEVSEKKIKRESISESAEPILPGANDFWNISQPEKIEEESSEDEDKDANEALKKQKKKKMTPAERAEIARLEEERLRAIETELADSEATPKTADQFDRLVLAHPNNSLFWINYMAFHLEATEIEKARTVARKALTTIEFREEQEKLNVWIAFLNLENRYGTKDSFSTVLEEAVQMNDSLTVYLQALNILSDSKKTTEFSELLTNVTRKFKQEFKMWIGTAEACYKCELKEQARNLMQRALKSLDEKQHVNLLVQFAFMESRFDDPERAEALLEKVLASYPRRVDVWTSYVDMLIKGNRIHIARNVLERAAGQKLPARKMKTIFTKYIQFETKYGDEDSVNKVRQMASEYVKTALQ